MVQQTSSEIEPVSLFDDGGICGDDKALEPRGDPDEVKQDDLILTDLNLDLSEE